MKKTVYAILVMAAPLLAQCPNQLFLAQNVPLPCTNPIPAREFGQPTLLVPSSPNSVSLNSTAPNLVVGQELYNPSAIAFDSSVTPPHVYVVDTGNNRVLGWSNANNITMGNQADMVLGQPAATGGGFDFTATLPWYPGSPDNVGLNNPTGIAVDAAGNVYVSDSGNNRILRFPTPYQQQAGNVQPDLVIGQKNVASGNSPNLGQSSPSASSLYLSAGTPYTNNRNQNPFPQDPVIQAVIPAALCIDSAGNLWATDPGNNRVLMYSKTTLSAGTQLPAASLVLGQSNFNTNQLPSANVVPTNGSFVEAPTGVAVDTNGNVYVTDSYGRALYYPAPVAQGETAPVILGLPQTQSTIPTYPTQYSLGSISSGGTNVTDTPQCVFTAKNASGGITVYVCDAPQNRVVWYNSMAVPTGAHSPQITGVIGQPGLTQGQINQGQTTPTNQSLAYPTGGAIRPDNGELWVVDQANHRVIVFVPQGGGSFSIASRVLGQLDFNHNGANLLQGRELWLYTPNSIGGGIAVDSTSCTPPSFTAPISCTSPPHLYIADTVNNRVLGFNDARLVGVNSLSQLTQMADIVIGQTDLQHNLANSPNNTTGSPTATGLNDPVGLAVDSQGNLWVADTGNGRVVRFPAPFSQPPGTIQTANLVLGQASLTSYNPSVTQFNMKSPFGLAFMSNGSLVVSDPVANRVLVFAGAGGTLTNAQAATYVIGQTGFGGSSSGGGPTQLNSPRHLSVDSSNRVYVCDYNNSRLTIYNQPTASGPPAASTVSFNGAQPEAIVVSLASGLSWVALSDTVVQLPEFESLQATEEIVQELQQNLPDNNSNQSVPPTLALALDPWDNVIVADGSNRVSFYFPELFYRNAASYSAGLGGQGGAGPTPTMLAEIHPLGNCLPTPCPNFSFPASYSGTAVNSNPPWPTTYTNGGANVQLTVNGYPAPVFRVDAPPYNSGVLVEIPNEAPSSGPANFVLSNPVTGQIYAVATYTMQPASPGIFTTNAEGTGYAAANSLDANGNALGNGINSASNPVPPGGIIGLWLTGAGNVPGLPADGIAPGSAVYTPVVPIVYINGTPAKVLGSAMSPQFPGLWQINVVVPASVVPTSVSPISVYVQLDGFNSTIGGQGTDANPGPDQALTVPNGLITTIYVK